jgi:hypothetical protein
MTYLEDEAESGGFDVTANLKSLPVSWTLCEDEDGNAYRLKMSSAGATLSLKSEDGEKVLARVAMALKPGQLVLQRRGGMWRVLESGRFVLEAHDDSLDEGRVGFSGGVEEARVQPVEEVVFDDDFMRVKEEAAMAPARANPGKGVRIADVKTEETLWKVAAGGWSTTGLSENAEAQVAQSVNAFVFKTTAAGENLALGGRAFWSDYTLEASVRPEGARALGLAFYAQDAKNYLLFRWEARQGLDESTGRAVLQAVVDGKVRTLAQGRGGFEDRQWYRLKVVAVGDLVRAFVDDNEVARARTTLFGRGQAGLWAYAADAKATALFDDVRVRSDRDLEDDFSRVVPGRWQAQAGTWNWKGAAQATGAGVSRAVSGDKNWSNYAVSAPLALPADASAGLLLHATGDSGYLLRVGGSRSAGGFAGRAQIIKMTGGKAQVLATAPTGASLDGHASTLGFSMEDGYLAASVNGRRIADAFDETHKEGRAGLWSQRATAAPTFGAFGVRFPDPRPTWAKVPDLYDEERQAETMGGWSTPQGFWLPARPLGGAAGGAKVTPAAAPPGQGATLWHKGAFWGDGTMKFKAPDLKPGQSFAILLDTAGSSGTAGGKGEIELVFTVKDGALQAAARRDGKALGGGSTKIEGKASDYTVHVRQRGSYIIARAYKSEEERKTLFATRFR